MEDLQKAGFIHYSARSLILSVIAERGRPNTRDSMIAVANELRSSHHPAYIIERLLERAQAAGGDSIIESVRTVGEVNALRSFAKHSSATCTLLAVDASLEVRYDRIVVRGSSTDKVSIEEFRRQEQGELVNDDPAKQNLSAVMALADHRIQNDGSRESLSVQVDRLLG